MIFKYPNRGQKGPIDINVFFKPKHSLLMTEQHKKQIHILYKYNTPKNHENIVLLFLGVSIENYSYSWSCTIICVTY